MRDSTTIFDQEGEAAADTDLTREFWGDAAGWIVPGDGRTRASVLQVRRSEGHPETFDLDHTPVSLRGIRDGFAAFRPQRRWRDDSTGPIERTREHGVVGSARPAMVAGGATAARGPKRPSPDALPHRDASIGALAAGQFDETGVGSALAYDDEALVPLVPAGGTARTRAGGVDPVVVRMTLLVAALLLAIPFALFLRSSNEPTVETDLEQVPPPTGDALVQQDATSNAPAALPVSGDSQAQPPAATADPSAATGAVEPVAAPSSADATATAQVEAPPAVQEPTESVSVEPLAEATEAGIATPATVEEAAKRTVPDCSRTYTAGPGDSWYRIADAAGVTPHALLDQNRATVDTVIFPGTEICLPPGATMPSPPTTVAAAPERPATSAPTTTPVPKTTAPATTNPPPPASSRDEVQAMIREIWPDELEERALEIARRESNFRSSADNGSCCVGVFQLYWSAHRSWLDDYGIHSRDDLKDARKNITAALGLYERSGGWGPWGG